MADDATTVTTTTAADMKATAEATDAAKASFSGFNAVAEFSSDILGSIHAKMRDWNIAAQNSHSTTQNQALAFNMLGAAVVGARRSFDGLAGVKVDNLSTFTSQIDSLQRVVSDNNFIGTAAQKADYFAKSLGNIGLSIPTKIIGDGIWAISAYAKNILESADNSLRLQNAFIQLSAQTGNLKDVYQAAGPHLNNINFLLQQQQDAVISSSKATNVAAEQVEKYWAELGRVPGALEANVRSGTGMKDSVSMLTAAIRYSTGSGRDFASVMEDLKTAFRDYGIVGEDALKFTARMGELSTNFKVELDDVRNSLRGTADNFKIFGNEAEGAANMMNQYLGALKQTGLSGSASIQVLGGLTEGVKNLSLAQKALISAQSGGPGGLMGAFQIEKELREGKIDKVFDKVRATMQKQFGSLVSLNEASSSPQAAAQLTKQMQMLKSGPLGTFAKDDQTAMRIIEAFKNREATGAPVTKELSDTILQDTMQVGTDIAQKSYSEISRIREGIDEWRASTNTAALDGVQQVATASTGTPARDEGNAEAMRSNLKASMQRGAAQSAATTEDYAKDLKGGKIRDQAARVAGQVMGDFSAFFAELSPALKAPIEKISKLLKEHKGSEAQATYEDHLKQLDQRRKEVQKAPLEMRSKALANIDKEESALRGAMGYLAASSGETKPFSVPKVKIPTVSSVDNLSGQEPSGTQVGQAAQNAVKKSGQATNPAQQAHPAQHPQTPTSGEMTVTVDVRMTPDAQKLFEMNAQATKTNPAHKL